MIDWPNNDWPDFWFRGETEMEKLGKRRSKQGGRSIRVFSGIMVMNSRSISDEQ